MKEDTETLLEMMLSAELFCAQVESAAQDLPKTREQEELRLKVAQCQTLLRQIQEIYDAEELSIENVLARDYFRQLVLALLWVAFRARQVMNFRLYRRLVVIESAFTYLLVSR
jgi:ribosomal protein L29